MGFKKLYHVKQLRQAYPDKPESCIQCQMFAHCRSYKLPMRKLQKGKGSRKVLLLLMNPGVEEDKQGEILVGKSGKLLQQYVEEHFRGVAVWATNVVKCGNGKEVVYTEHIKQCLKFLEEDIDSLNPDVIITMGQEAKAAVKLLQQRR